MISHKMVSLIKGGGLLALTVVALFLLIPGVLADYTNCQSFTNFSTCDADADCEWEGFKGECIPDCWQYDHTDNDTCIAAFNGTTCDWEAQMDLCDPIFMNKSWGGFSPCFEFDGNKTGCNNMSEQCAWFPEPNCQSNTDHCWDVTGGSDHGICDPSNFNFGGNYSCIQYDGNKTGCDEAKETMGWACEWHSDAWGPLMPGETEAGWCDELFGGGTGSGCWDYFDNESCSSAASIGMPCEWKSESSSGWCEEKGCWDYWDNSSCAANANEGCEWNSDYNYCYEVGCWDIGDQTNCTNALTDYGLSCSWQGGASNGWCEEDGCWKRDWTNQTYCEAQEGCSWNGNWCEEKGCWNYDSNGQVDCENKSLTGLDCEWKTGDWGWCEQKGCWSYDETNETACVNVTEGFGMSCDWDSGNSICYEVFQGCSEYDGDEYGCYGSGWCYWDPGAAECKEPAAPSTNFYNPECWIFDKAGEAKCNNVTTCTWNGGSSTCDNDGVGQYGVQCDDINNSQMCNNLPMLSTCCQWNGTGCQDAQFTTACWDNMQEPPEGAYFCDDFNAKNSKSTCEQIAGDPWYMPCYWNTTKEECMFEFEDMFGGKEGDFGFSDIGSKSNCEALGGSWISEKWSDNSGAVYTDEWCEMGFGVEKEDCNDMCWACEYQDNGTAWESQEGARSACDQSAAGCNFFADTNAFNGQGWCDKDRDKSGNCDQNCWDCWETEQCGNSLAQCKWFVDPYNSNAGWCDNKNAKTCDTECYMCWDQDNCMNSDASCTWDVNNWFCTPQGSGEGGESSEICFDGIDNDADNFVDCSDPECMFDDFCGGSAVFGSNCPSIQDNETCINQSCVWITDTWNNSWCDMEGAQCWTYDDNQTACEAESGCNYMNMTAAGMSGDTFCDVNFTKADNAQCWNYPNQTSCDAQNSSGCTWTNDKWCEDNPTDTWCQANLDAGWCDYEVWSCWQYDQNQTACEDEAYCGWETDWFDPSRGWCSPICFSLNETACDSNSYCETFDSDGYGWCEPENMFKGCWDYADNNTCLGDTACTWIDDPFVPGGGFCSDKFMYDMVGDMDQSPPHELAWEECTTGSNEQSDICFMGIKDDPENLGFGLGVASMSNAAVCSKFGEGGENRTTKYYWYLDTDGSQTGGCTVDDNASLSGFEFKFKYEAQILNDVLTENKVAYKCLDSNWSASKIKLNAWIDKMCYMVMGGTIAVSKEDLQKLKTLNLFDESADMRIYGAAANDGAYNSSDNPYDVIGPAWYTPNSADFKFEDCSGFTDMDGDGLAPEDDPDCEAFLRYGYIEVEAGTECADSIDNDGNGLTDCADYGCMYDAYYCSASVDDNKAPELTWMKTEEFLDGAFVDISTNEPTNASLFFHKNDSYCSNKTDAIEILDFKLENDFDLDDYDMWHGLPADNYYFNEKSISYQINESGNQTYYYKVKLCDQSNNCALSACTPFTTRTEEKEFTIGFKLPPPLSDATELLGNVNVQFDWGADGTYDENATGTAGKKINDTTGKKVNMKFANPNATDQWEIEFKGAQFKNAQSINVTDSLIVNETGDGDKLVGIKKSKWEELAQKLGVDSVKIVIPQGVATPSEGKLKHCPDDITDIDDSSCVEINLDDVNCTITTTETTCDIPTSIGFSVFAVYMVSATTPGDDGGSGGSGGTGGGGGGAVEEMTYLVSDEQLEEGYSKKIREGDRFKFTVGGEEHTTTLVEKNEDSVRIAVASKTQYATLRIDEFARFELDGDNFYDLSVTLNEITATRADLTVKRISEKMEVKEEVEAEKEEPKEEVAESNMFQIMIFAAGAMVLIILAVLLLRKKKE